MARLVRDAAALGVGSLDPDAVRAELARLAAEAFPDGEGILRVDVREAAGEAPHLESAPRPLGVDPPRWRARIVSRVHPGPAPALGAKLADRPALLEARRTAREAGADEAYLLDAAGRLVEGARSTPVVVTAGGDVRTPPLARGGVAGLARAVALERLPELREADVDRDDLAGARELVALNAARGARPVVALDGQPIGAGRPGPWARRLADALAADEPL